MKETNTLNIYSEKLNKNLDIKVINNCIVIGMENDERVTVNSKDGNMWNNIWNNFIWNKDWGNGWYNSTQW